jgi:transcriptional regulator with GAF, ATPase, and Fis domain
MARTAPSEKPQVLTASELQELERKNLLNALEQSRFRIAGESGAARLVGMSPSTFAYRMKQLGIQRPRAS